ncbi:hypothetical protein [Pontibacter liquoris]|uniref:hypothetical protein n=1 Tax=Pontibacter liquoris TaxID=2905677 RepID=UPI001FA75349|nr:hypothetical protein [Pontibacter liquoris]
MKNAKLLTLLLLALVFNLSSCGDDGDDPAPLSTKAQFLTAKPWNIAVIIFDGDTVTNDPDPDLARIKSTRINFNKNGTYKQLRTDGIEEGNWKLTDNDTHLIYGPNASNQQDWEVLELQDNLFKGRTVYKFDTDTLDVQVDMKYEE